MKIKFKKENKDAKIPKKADEGCSGYDLYAYLLDDEGREIEKEIYPHNRCLIMTGISLEIPKNCEGQVRPRSGFSLKKGVTVLNTPGTIDSSYRGEIGVILYNSDSSPVTIKHGDRIAQIVFSPVLDVKLQEVEELSSSDRGNRGFGSSGDRD